MRKRVDGRHALTAEWRLLSATVILNSFIESPSLTDPAQHVERAFPTFPGPALSQARYIETTAAVSSPVVFKSWNNRRPALLSSRREDIWDNGLVIWRTNGAGLAGN